MSWFRATLLFTYYLHPPCIQGLFAAGNLVANWLELKFSSEEKFGLMPVSNRFCLDVVDEGFIIHSLKSAK